MLAIAMGWVSLIAGRTASREAEAPARRRIDGGMFGAMLADVRV